MTKERHQPDLSRTAVVIPALNEAENLDQLLPLLVSQSFGQILVCDNGSTDDTHGVIDRHGAQWVHEPRRGYGSACFAGLKQLDDTIDVVAFIDADLSDDPTKLTDLVMPVLRGEFDLVIGARVASLREPGSMTLPQRFANRLFPVLLRLGWGHSFADMGPMRAIHRRALDEIDMQDRDFGWTIEMQIRAVELGLRIHEVPVPYRKRSHGPSKISGNIRGVARAAYWLTRTCAGLWLTKRRRAAGIRRTSR